MDQQPMTIEQAMGLQIAAYDRLEHAQAELRLAGVRINAFVADAPLRFKVAASERYRRAQAEVDFAQAAYDAAQDIECTEWEE